MKFKKIDKGHYRALENGVMFDIIKCNYTWVMEYRLHREYKGTRAFSTLKECKIYANNLYMGLKDVRLC